MSAKDDKPCSFATDSKLQRVLVQNASLIVSNHRYGNSMVFQLGGSGGSAKVSAI